MENSDWVSVAAAVISLGAAVFALMQARSAKRQAAAAHGDVDPTFHIQRRPSNGVVPWFFTIEAANFNKRPLMLESIQITVHDDNAIAFDVAESTRGVVRAAVQIGRKFVFNLNATPNHTLPGIAPNSGNKTVWEKEYGIGVREAPVANEIPITVSIRWRYGGEPGMRVSHLDEVIRTGIDPA